VVTSVLCYAFFATSAMCHESFAGLIFACSKLRLNRSEEFTL